MNKLDESEIIKKFQKTLGNRNFVSEDVESFSIGNSNVIAKVDTLVQSTDIPPQMSLNDAARKSIVAKKVIPKSATITLEDLTVKRPGNGIPPKYLKQIIGRKAKQTIEKDKQISWEIINK